MIDKKYIELMNKEIDNVISEDERISLHSYLSGNKAAKEYYNELRLTNDYLDSLPDPEPSENLKKYIVNSIDFSRYSASDDKKSFWSFLYRPKFKYAYIFAAGIIAGIIIISIFSNSFNYKDTSGTIGVENIKPEMIKEIPLKFSDISGKIELLKTGNNFSVNADFNSTQKFDFVIKYGSDVEFQSVNPKSNSNIEFSNGENSIKTSSEGIQQYNFLFSKSGNKVSSIHIQLIKSDNIVYQGELKLN